MNKIVKNRIIFIKILYDALDALIASEEANVIEIENLVKFISFIQNDENKHFVCLSNLTTADISFARKPEEIFIINKRILTRVGRYINTYCKEFSSNLSDVCIDSFVRKINVCVSKLSIQYLDTRIKSLTGAEITDFYKATNAHSCMTGQCNNYKLLLYKMNPDKVCLLVFDDEVRALLWTCDDGSKVLDRAYPSGHNKIDLLRSWAETKGYILRKNPDQNVVDQTILLSNNSFKKITLKHCQLFPFADTFRYGEYHDDYIILSNNIDYGDVKLQTDSGIFIDVHKCKICGNKKAKNRDMLSDNNIEFVYICDYCYSSMFFHCVVCSKTLPSTQIGINGDTSTRKRFYCKRCVKIIQNTVKYNVCKCASCDENIFLYKEILSQNGLLL